MAGDARYGTEKWGYSGPTAPEYWGGLSTDYALCAEGLQQSPVDITGYRTGAGQSLEFSYRGDSTAVRNDGTFIHLDFQPVCTLNAGGRLYHLATAHFHSPSEHWIDGRSFAAELHLVHQHSGGDLAVVGVLFELGEPDPLMEEVLGVAPAPGGAIPEGPALDPTGFLPGEWDYFRYDGSKTTPPCDEPVDWYVLRQPRTISLDQVNRLRALGRSPNNRPVQALGNRGIAWVQ